MWLYNSSWSLTSSILFSSGKSQWFHQFPWFCSYSKKNGGWWSHIHTPPICAFQSADSPLGPRARDRSINASKDVPLKSPGAPLRPSNLLQSVRDCNKWESVLQQSPTPKSKGINLSQKSDLDRPVSFQRGGVFFNADRWDHWTNGQFITQQDMSHEKTGPLLSMILSVV